MLKENEQFDLICNDITLKHDSHGKILGVTIDNKLSFEHINNICKTASNKKQNKQTKKLNALILHNFSFQILSHLLDVLLQKIY